MLLDLGDDLVGVVSLTEFSVLNADGEAQLTQTWPTALVDVPHFDRGLLIAATENQAVTAYSIEPS